ncbi:MAG: Transcription initiation factor TFIID subunit 9 [Alyxoria varia]|nr:MAG: Transcription initiation factor TFIID subunit 9 [Alyxoria varia]
MAQVNGSTGGTQSPPAPPTQPSAATSDPSTQQTGGTSTTVAGDSSSTDPSQSQTQPQQSQQPPASTADPSNQQQQQPLTTTKNEDPTPDNKPSLFTTPHPHAQTSTTDAGSTPRPRDARTLHMLFSALGIPTYQDRVPLLLLDYAYRYTVGVLSDAQHLASEGYTTHVGPGMSSSGARARELSSTSAGSKDGELNVQTIRMAVASRAAANTGGAGSGGPASGGGLAGGGQGGPSTGSGLPNLPKESMLELARDVNAVRLQDPTATEAMGDSGQGGGQGGGVYALLGSKFGIKLPGEKYLLSGVGWGIDGVPEEVEGALASFDGANDTDDSEDERDDAGGGGGGVVGGASGKKRKPKHVQGQSSQDQEMAEGNDEEDGEDDEDEDEDETDEDREGFAQVFGSDAANADAAGGDGEDGGNGGGDAEMGGT